MSGPGGILALDLALRTGWAYGLPGLRGPVHGVYDLPVACGSGRTLAALGNAVADAITLHQPRLVLVEAPLVRQDRSAKLLLGLAAVADAVCYWLEVECREQSATTVRKAVLGRGTFPKGEAKAAVMAWCHAQGWTPRDDNAADACVLWEFARRHVAAKPIRAAA